MAESKKKDRYRNPANDLIDAAVGGTKKAAGAVGRTAKKSVKATSAAASSTVKKESEASSKDRSQLAKRKAELERRRKEAEKTKPKPAPITKPTQGDYKSRFAGARDAAFAKAKQITGESPAKPAPKPVPKPAAQATPKPSVPKPAPKPAGKVPSGERRVSASTANRESGNYGTSRTNNPLMKDLKDAMRRREERQGVGPVKDGNRYAADVKNNTSGVGPVKSGDTYASALKPKSGSEKLQEAQKERAAKAKRDAEERAKKARERLAASASKKPGSTYG